MNEAEKERQNTCGDAISRQAVMEGIRNLYPDIPVVDIMSARRKWLDKYAPYFECENVVEQLPSVTPQQRTGRWIPVSERVPEDGEEVLCFLGSEEMAVLFRRNNWGQYEWVDGGFATGSYDVIAWMPLPEPYKAESEVDS